MRTKLKVLRVRLSLTQEQMADSIGVKRATYSSIENGTRDGRIDFWIKLQKAHKIADAEMWQLQQNT